MLQTVFYVIEHLIAFLSCAARKCSVVWTDSLSFYPQTDSYYHIALLFSSENKQHFKLMVFQSRTISVSNDKVTSVFKLISNSPVFISPLLFRVRKTLRMAHQCSIWVCFDILCTLPILKMTMANMHIIWKCYLFCVCHFFFFPYLCYNFFFWRLLFCNHSVVQIHA